MNCKPHHWVIEEPHGSPHVMGECRHCGETRLFRASADQPDHWLKGAIDVRRAALRQEGQR